MSQHTIRATRSLLLAAALGVPALAFTAGAAGAATTLTGADAACPAGRAPEPPADVELTEVRVATLPIVDFAAVFYAAACGLFAAEGLDVTLETVQGGVVGAQLLTSGDVDFTIVSWFGFAQAVANGAPLVGVANGTVMTPETNYIFVPAGSEIDTPEELVGTSLGVNTPVSVGDIATTAILRDRGLDGDPAWVATPLPEILPAIQSGALDGGHLVEPFVTAAEAAGLEPVLDLADGPLAGLPLAGYATLRATTTEQSELVAGFRAGIEQATAALGADGDALRAFVVTYTTVPPELVEQIALPDFAERFDAADVQKTIDAMAGAGFLPEPLDITPHLVTAGS